ncbi:cell division protein ZapA [Tianweitania sediminis]|jgi:cell division protein ZapA|uniref:Cell division protein ZapA n=1 Tax=Tianweitania sediminis TaxID=1502156 RepID=A0A8J7UHU5_9HYPH|nr:cell division protein ZapA [Tianweitania sediminis]MBP0438183.1 cell division protein ZapA [Tianweitania sediminis]HEV7415072.1 cell division protein ZapA [Tianweitania sediminis]
MPQVTVTIDGKAYRMACDEGQEEHLFELAQRFDRYVGHLKSNFGEIGDQRLTVMAGIMILDELSEVQTRLKSLEGELDGLQQSRDEVLQKAAQDEATLGTVLLDVAERIEALTANLAPKPG